MKGAPATPLYVRSFIHYMGPEFAMKLVFEKARQNSPSLLVLEDLDNLITPQTRSFFLNQVDRAPFSVIFSGSLTLQLDGLGDNDGQCHARWCKAC